ncbi:MAG: hypothetical protein M3430_06480 [Acidobacteriota bacterium]|nr:hypothetical protein [Acidobacteriota bacterium]
MIQLTTAAKLEKAITKARTVKPRVRVNCFGSYTVTNKRTRATSAHTGLMCVTTITTAKGIL